MRQLTSLLFLALIASIGEQATAKSATLAGSSIACQAQKAQTVHATGETNLYLAGAVPEVNGQVVFQQVYAVPGKTRDAIFNELKQYLDQVLKRPNALPASRITAAETEEGTLAMTLHETLWFKRSAWVSDFATIICQLTFEVRDGGYTATLRNIRYQYDALTDAQQDNLLQAELDHGQRGAYQKRHETHACRREEAPRQNNRFENDTLCRRCRSMRSHAKFYCKTIKRTTLHL